MNTPVSQAFTDYVSALLDHDLDRIASTLAEDLMFVSATRILDKGQFIAMLSALYAGFPDWDHGYDGFEDRGDGQLGPASQAVGRGDRQPKDDVRRAATLEEQGIHYVDVGTSGGVWGLAEGYSMMIGGETDAVSRLSPIFETLAPAADQGWGHVGPVGAGHFVKMVHNGIEYGLMQAYAEGFEIMNAKKDFDLDLHQVAEIWRYGSVVRSWLLDLTANALDGDQELSEIAGYVSDSGEGRWTVFEAVDLDVPAPVITLSLQQRFISRQDESYAAKLLAAMRNQFGGHAVKKAD